MDEQFRILVVCTGNVCRSPLAERIIRTRLASALGQGAARFAVTSAGTRSRPGLPMDPRAARTADGLGVDVRDFSSREMTPADVAAADLVLTASREHRARVVQLHPAAHRYAFTILEFSRLAGSLPPAATPPAADVGSVDAGDPRHGGHAGDDGGTGGVDGAGDAAGNDAVEAAVRRARLLVTGAASLRGAVRARRPEDDDVIDPVGGAGQVHRAVGTVIADALAGPLEVITGASYPRMARSVRRSGPSGHSGRSNRPGDTRGPVRRWAVRATTGLGVVALLVLLAAGFLALRAVQAAHELGRARTGVATLRAQLLAGDQAGARRTLPTVAGHTRRARGLTSGPLWRAAAAPPYLGNTARAVRVAAAAADELSRRVLPPVVGMAASLDPAAMRPAGDTVALARFDTLARPAHAASAAMAAVRTRVEEVDRSWLVPPVASGFGRMRGELGTMSSTLDSLDRATRLVPAMLGGSGPRHYLVAIQNNAEARGTGGLVGLYAVVTADHGRVRMDTLGSNTALRNAPDLPVDLGQGFRDRWGDNPALWSNSNMDPDFSYAAKLWLALWARQTGQHLDGVVATDPVVLGYVLRATGPVRLSSGDTISAANAAATTMSRVYARFPDDNDRRDAYMRDVAGQLVAALLSGRGDPRMLLRGLSQAATERRLLVYSTHPAEERQLTGTALGGTLPGGDGPYAFVVVNNAAGSKMDYYLRRSLTYSSDRCESGRRQSRIEVTVTNTAPAASVLPHYVTQREDASRATLTQSAAPDSLSLLVSVYGPRGGELLQATVDGHPLTVSPHTQDGRPAWAFPLVVGHGRHRTVVLDIAEPATDAAPVIPVQPLVQPETVHTALARCD